MSMRNAGSPNQADESPTSRTRYPLVSTFKLSGPEGEEYIDKIAGGPATRTTRAVRDRVPKDASLLVDVDEIGPYALDRQTATGATRCAPHPDEGREIRGHKIEGQELDFRHSDLNYLVRHVLSVVATYEELWMSSTTFEAIDADLRREILTTRRFKEVIVLECP